MASTLNIIGGGKLGRTLARLWHDNHQLRIGQIMCTSQQSASRAAAFIGAGRGVWQFEQLQAADLWLIATPDGLIADIAAQLAEQAPMNKRSLAFHCSGALPSTELEPLARSGLAIASIHPVHSFAHPEQSLSTFAGSVCAYEGDKQALATLLPLFNALSAKLLPIDRDAKGLYHTGSVMACNYLVPLLEASLQCLQGARLSREDAAQLLSPLVHATVDNVLRGSGTGALTGPISRGDTLVVARQLQALHDKLPELIPLYRTLGERAVKIAKDQESAAMADLDQIVQLLGTTASNPS